MKRMPDYMICVIYVLVLWLVALIIFQRKWPAFARKVILGYKSIVEMNIDEEKSIKSMLYMIQLIMMKYFIKNNYEYIADVNIKMINYISEVW